MTGLLRTLARGGVTPVTRRTIAVPAPAANTGITITPTNGVAWEVLSINQSYVSDGSAANRSLNLALTDGNNTLWTIPSTAVQAASLTRSYAWLADYPVVNAAFVGANLAIAIPHVILVPGWTLTETIVNGQTTDQLGTTYVQVLEAFTGDTEAEYNFARAIAHHAEAISDLLNGEVPGL